MSFTLPGVLLTRYFPFQIIAPRVITNLKLKRTIRRSNDNSEAPSFRSSGQVTGFKATPVPMLPTTSAAYGGARTFEKDAEEGTIHVGVEVVQDRSQTDAFAPTHQNTSAASPSGWTSEGMPAFETPRHPDPALGVEHSLTSPYSTRPTYHHTSFAQ